MLPPLNIFTKHFGLLFLCYQSKGIYKKHRKKFEYIEITLVLSKKIALPEKCPNTEFFLVRIFPHSAWNGEILLISPYSARMQENTEKTPYLDIFHTVQVSKIPRNYLTKPSNDFMIPIFMFHQIHGFIIQKQSSRGGL